MYNSGGNVEIQTKIERLTTLWHNATAKAAKYQEQNILLRKENKRLKRQLNHAHEALFCAINPSANDSQASDPLGSEIR